MVPRNVLRRNGGNASSSLPRHLVRQIATRLIIVEQLLIALPAHFHKYIRRLLTRRALLPLRLDSMTIGFRLFLGGLTPVKLLTIGILLVDLDRDLTIIRFDDFADFDVVEGTEQGAFALDFPLGEVKRVHGARQAVGAVGRIQRSRTSYPGVFEAFVDGDAFVNVDGEHAVDKVQGRVADRVPIGRGVIETTHLDLLREVVRVFGGVKLVGEGREAAQANVEHDAKGPHVDSARIFAVARVLQDFRCNV